LLHIDKYNEENRIKQAVFSIKNKTLLGMINFCVKSSRIFKIVFPSRRTIAKALDLKSEKQVTRLTNHLVKLKILTKSIHKKTRTCVYILNPLVFKLWINFYRQIPALSILFPAPQKPVSDNNVPLYKKDKGIIYDSCPENVLNNHQHFLVNNPDPAFAHKPTPQQVQAFSEILEKIFKEPEKQVDIAREALICSPPPNIFLKNEGYDTREYQSDLAGLLDGLTRRIRVDLKISKFLM